MRKTFHETMAVRVSSDDRGATCKYGVDTCQAIEGLYQVPSWMVPGLRVVSSDLNLIFLTYKLP